MTEVLTAPHDLYGTDGAGVRRFVAAGDPVPHGLEVEGDVDFGEHEPSGEEKRLAAEKAKREGNIAPHDLYGLDAAGLRRFIRAGDPIPAGLKLEEPIGDDEPGEDTDAAEASGDLDEAASVGAQEPAASDEPVAAGVPFDGYDEASVPAIKKHLGESTAEDVEAIKAYEREHRNRPSIVNYGA